MLRSTSILPNKKGRMFFFVNRDLAYMGDYLLLDLSI